MDRMKRAKYKGSISEAFCALGRDDCDDYWRLS